MTTIIVIASILLALLGIVLAIWSITDTRKKHYNDYIIRKRND